LAGGVTLTWLTSHIATAATEASIRKRLVSHGPAGRPPKAATALAMTLHHVDAKPGVGVRGLVSGSAGAALKKASRALVRVAVLPAAGTPPTPFRHASTRRNSACVRVSAGRSLWWITRSAVAPTHGSFKGSRRLSGVRTSLRTTVRGPSSQTDPRKSHAERCPRCPEGSVTACSLCRQQMSETRRPYRAGRWQ
jgi:hypothetical protein